MAEVAKRWEGGRSIARRRFAYLEVAATRTVDNGLGSTGVPQRSRTNDEEGRDENGKEDSYGVRCWWPWLLRPPSFLCCR